MNEHQDHQPHQEAQGEHHEHHDSHQASKAGLPPLPKLDFHGVNMKSLQNGLKDIWAILRLDRAKIKEVAGRESEGIGLAFVYLVIGGIATSLGGLIFGYTLPILGTVRLSPVNALLGAVVSVAVQLIGFYLADLIANRFFQGKGHFAALMRVMGYASLIMVVGVCTFFPLLGVIASIWLVVVYFVVLRELYQLSNVNVILVIILTGIAVAILFSILRVFGLSPYATGFGGGSFSLNY